MLDGLSREIDSLSVAVTRFKTSRSTLVTAIGRLDRKAERNRSFLVRWTPVLLGNLRLINQRSANVRDDMWILVAIVLLEKQVAGLGQRVRHADTSRLMLRNLDDKENQIDMQREQLLRTLADIRVQLRQIRRKATTTDRV